MWVTWITHFRIATSTSGLVQERVVTHLNIFRHTVLHCNALQLTATHCNTLQHRMATRTSVSFPVPMTLLRTLNWCDTCVAWHIRTSDMTRPYVWHDSSIRLTWLILMCAMTYTCVIWLIHLYHMSHSHVWHDATICVSSFVYPASHLDVMQYMCDTHLVHMCDTNSSHW